MEATGIHVAPAPCRLQDLCLPQVPQLCERDLYPLQVVNIPYPNHSVAIIQISSRVSCLFDADIRASFSDVSIQKYGLDCVSPH